MMFSVICRVEKNHDLKKKILFFKFKLDLFDFFYLFDFFEIWYIDIYIDV